MALLTAIRSLLRRKPTPDTELGQQRVRLNKHLTRIQTITARNQVARTASYLEHLESQGLPFYQPPQRTPTPERREQKISVPVFSYQPDPATAYPFATRMDVVSVDRTRYEQDPIFGWFADPFNPTSGLYDWGAGIPVNAFPREMYPDRPTSLRTQIAQDAVRIMSRLWYETVPQYAGIVGHLRNYIVGEGMDNEVTSDTDEGLAKAVKEWLDAFCKHKFNNINKRVRDSVLNLYRDGEDSLHLVQKSNEDYPRIRSVDTSTIRGPHNEVNGPWGFGCLTDWPKDWDEVLAYHLWYSDNSHEDVSPTVFKLAKLDTTGSNVKRGVPLAYKIRKQLPQLGTLLDAMAIGEAARQSIPYIQQYQNADKFAVQNSIQGSLQNWGTVQAIMGNACQPDTIGNTRINPGEVQHINQGQEYKSPPQGYAGQGTDAYQALCEAVAAACNVPIWFALGGSDKENYSSAFVKESPLVKNVQHAQGIVTDHYESMMGAAVDIAARAGTFPPDVMKICRIHCKLPTPISRDKFKDLEADLLMVDKGLLSPQDCCTRNGLEFDAQQGLIKQARAKGWKTPAEMMAEMQPDNNAAGKDVSGSKPSSEEE